MASDERWTTSNSAYGSFWDPKRAVPLEPHVLQGPGKGGQEDSRRRLAALLQRHRLRERPVCADGNCQFRALADQLYGAEAHHEAVRHDVLRQLRKLPEKYAAFVPGDYQSYLEAMGQLGTWGDHVTLQAAADSLGLRIQILSDYLTDAFIEVVPVEVKSSRVLRLSYWAETHYNSLEV